LAFAASSAAASHHWHQRLREARAREGARLATMLLERVAHLRTLAQQAEPLVPAVVQRQQARFLERWNEALTQVKAGSTVPEHMLHDKALGEAASYAIRIDVAEELSRLASHLDEIERLLKAGGELGKRLWENVSREAWQAWLKHQTMLVNENRLNLADTRARKYLAVQMEKYFFGDGGDRPAGYVPPAT
jgi:uncharacterized protein (TIGR00255 family)